MSGAVQLNDFVIVDEDVLLLLDIEMRVATAYRGPCAIGLNEQCAGEIFDRCCRGQTARIRVECTRWTPTTQMKSIVEIGGVCGSAHQAQVGSELMEDRISHQRDLSVRWRPAANLNRSPSRRSRQTDSCPRRRLPIPSTRCRIIACPLVGIALAPVRSTCA